MSQASKQGKNKMQTMDGRASINRAVQENNECEEEEDDTNDYINYSDILQASFSCEDQNEKDECDSEEERRIKEEEEIRKALNQLVVSFGEFDVEDESYRREEEESGRGTDILDGFDSEKERWQEDDQKKKVNELLNQYRLQFESFKEESTVREKYFEERIRKAEQKAEEADKIVSGLNERLEKVERLLVEMVREKKKGSDHKSFENEEVIQNGKRCCDETIKSLLGGDCKVTVTSSDGLQNSTLSGGIRNIGAKIKDFWMSLF